ncbi:MAG: hypothetical protein JO307_27005 [Bryobacterales bacterium]|nr:hypothetical protein [Bryobacterales bacterium]
MRLIGRDADSRGTTIGLQFDVKSLALIGNVAARDYRDEAAVRIGSDIFDKETWRKALLLAVGAGYGD